MTLLHKMRNLLTGGMLLPSLMAHPGNAKPAEKPLQFNVNQGNNQNFFSKADNAAVQLVVTSGQPRIIAAFPAGNSGIGLWFDGIANLELIDPSHSRRFVRSQGNASSESVHFSIQSDQQVLTLKKVLLDNVRILRGAPPEKEIRPAREAYARAHGLPLTGYVAPKEEIGRLPDGEVVLQFERSDFGSKKPYKAELCFPPGTLIEKSMDGWKITNPNGKVSFEAILSVPYKAMTPFDPNELLTPAARQMLAFDKDPTITQAFHNLDFLAFKQKYLAGGWNYLTYFGRDTAFTLFMLGDMLTPQAHETALQSLLDRVSNKGEIPHEEDLGSLSQAERLARGEAPSQKPIFNYTMVDENFLLPIAFARYLKKVSPMRAQLFLNQKNARGETNRETLLRNYKLILSQAAPFAKSGLAKDLIRLKPGMSAGNWRDSRQGLAFGQYPADVNLWLLPAALQGINDTAQLIPNRIQPDKINHLIAGWKNAEKFFEVKLSADQVRNQVQAYLDKGPFTPTERKYFLSREIENRMTVGDFLNGKIPPVLKNGLTFPALSLDANGKPIPVMHSDPVLGLFLNNLSKEEFEKFLPLFTLPYPIGLRTEVGLLSANPCYTGNKNNLWNELNADAYHGTVIWVWPQSMLRLALADGGKRFRSDPPFAAKLRNLSHAYQQAENGLGSLALSELYTWEVRQEKGIARMVAIPYGVRATSQNEACSIQLWSSVLPAVKLAESGR